MRRNRTIALVAAGALAVAACGDDDNGESAETDAPTATEAPPATDAPAGTDAPTATDAPAGTDAPGGTMEPVTPGEDWPEELVFTLTPSAEAGGLIETAEPLAAMLEERLGVPVEPLVPTDYAGVIAGLSSGQAQIAGGLGPAQMVQAEDQADATLILQSERFGSLTYVTQWFTNDPDTYCEDEPAPAGEDGFLFCNGVGDAEDPAEGPIGRDSLANVEGETVAFVDQGSASGYLVPALELLNAGVDPVEDIETLFAGGHDSSVQAVYDGDAVVGVSFNDARGEIVEQVPDVGEQVVVFAWSSAIPNDGFAVAGDLPDDLKEAITAAFTDISESEEGAALLQELYEIDGLVPVTSADYDIMRELQTELGDLLE